jgi:hypothetical protein
MKSIIQLKTATPMLLIALVLLSFGLAPKVQAVSPPPDGSYPGGNTAEGHNALLSLTTGGFNTAVGWFSLESLTTGSFNTGVGAGTLVLNTGDQNTATGVGALLLNTTGSQNTANGALTLLNNTDGNFNTATGAGALQDNTGSVNTATGFNALFHNNGGVNTAIGAESLVSNTTGNFNTACGADALSSNTTGGQNIALGQSAGSHLTTGDNNIDIGNTGETAEASTIRIGQEGNQTATYIAGITGQTASGGVAVFVNTDGKLGTLTSSARFKDGIKSMDKASEAILALKPVTFRYKKEIDPTGTSQFGLVAEEVEKVNPDLVVRDKEGKPYSVRYEQVNAMLLNEFLKEHSKVEQQDCKIQQQETTIAQLKKEIEVVVAHAKEQDSKIERVSAQIEMSKPAPQVVNNP